MRLRHPFLVFVGVAALIVILDQVSKALARAQLVAGETIRLIPGIFSLTLVKNSGAAFGILSGRQPIFIAVTFLVIAVILIYLWRQRPASPLVVVALALVMGGAIGNLIDRLGTGWVTDFFEFSFIDFPLFNVADSAIFIGVGLLILWLLVSPQNSPVAQSVGESFDAHAHDGPAGGSGTNAS